MPCFDGKDCAPCKDCPPTPEPVMPRCDQELPNGVYPWATIVVEQGCITQVQEGTPPLYQPDSCCAPVGGGGGGDGLPGPPGPPGDPATIVIGEVTSLPPGSAPTVENVGTANDLILNWGIPRGERGEDGNTGSGLTDLTAGIEFENGLLQSLPVTWPPVLYVDAQVSGQATGITLTAAKNNENGFVSLELNIDDYDAALRAWVQEQIAGAIAPLQQQIQELQTRATSAEQRLDAIEARLDTCCPDGA